ncbi:restriction endonuclease subunit S [Ureaplasma diversum]|uniref:restriction endonuclease subunit S n=1 Tax=Ureaplasma diversum TaxID=42094 RepID=UPI000B0A3989|nr:restriction endonuclease subunit S [Ureaplasma diversum]
MENILELIKNEKVKWKRLGKVCLLNKFKQVDAKKIEQLNQYKGDVKLLPSSKNYDWGTTLEQANNLVNKGAVITLGRARYSNIKYHEGYFISSNNITICSKNENYLNNKFLYYFIFNNEKSFYKETGSYPKFDNETFKNTLIPIPSLEIQEKVVKILDKLTEYVTELLLRNKQYNYYRNFLLSEEYLTKKTLELCGENTEVKSRTLGDVCEIKRGRVISKKFLRNDENKGIYPVYSSQTLNNGQIGSINTYDFDGDYITWTTDGAYAGTVFYREGKFL